MNKKELLKYEKYFVSPSLILEIFKDEDEIPIEIIHLMTHREDPNEIIWYLGKEIYDEFKKIIKEEYEMEKIYRKSSHSRKNSS